MTEYPRIIKQGKGHAEDSQDIWWVGFDSYLGDDDYEYFQEWCRRNCVSKNRQRSSHQWIFWNEEDWLLFSIKFKS